MSLASSEPYTLPRFRCKYAQQYITGRPLSAAITSQGIWQDIREQTFPSNPNRALHHDVAGGGEIPNKTRIIVSHHDFEATPDDETLRGLVADMFKCGGDIAKIAATATDISDSARMLRLLEDQQGEMFESLLVVSPPQF